MNSLVEDPGTKSSQDDDDTKEDMVHMQVGTTYHGNKKPTIILAFVLVATNIAQRHASCVQLPMSRVLVCLQRVIYGQWCRIESQGSRVTCPSWALDAHWSTYNYVYPWPTSCAPCNSPLGTILAQDNDGYKVYTSNILQPTYQQADWYWQVDISLIIMSCFM